MTGGDEDIGWYLLFDTGIWFVEIGAGIWWQVGKPVYGSIRMTGKCIVDRVYYVRNEGAVAH